MINALSGVCRFCTCEVSTGFLELRLTLTVTDASALAAVPVAADTVAADAAADAAAGASTCRTCRS